MGCEQSCVPHPPRPKAGTGVCPHPLMSGQPHLMVALHSSDGTTTNCPCLSTGRLSLRVSGLCPLLVYLRSDTSPCLLNRPFTQGYKSSLYLLKSCFFFFPVWFFPPLRFNFCSFSLPPPTYISFSFAQHHLYSFPLEGTLGLQSLEKSLPSPGFDRYSAPLSSVACF